jgi:hypothetical protein
MGDEKKQDAPSDSVVELSEITNQLLKALTTIKPKKQSDEYSKLIVSQTASILALVYEKIRNAVEYREDHLIRRAAIERILRRRLSLNPDGKNEAENILRELLWARYFANGSLGEYDIRIIQKIIDRYVFMRNKLLSGRSNTSKAYIADFLIELITAEMEEYMAPEESKRESDFSYYIFQTLKNKIKIEGITEEQKDLYLFTAIEIAYRKSDTAYKRYHLFNLFYKPLSQYNEVENEKIMTDLPAIFNKIDDNIANPIVDTLTRFVRKQMPPYLILFSLLSNNKDSGPILKNKGLLWSKVEQIARDKYAQVKSRLNGLAIRSLIYIFLTKMLFAVVIEVPISQFIYDDIHILAIAVNSIAPPLLMLLIILTVSVPDQNNTKRLFLRIVDIVNRDQSFENSTAFIAKKPRSRRPLLNFGFSLLYISTFLVTLYVIHQILKLIHFNLLSEALFIFFISVVAFFAYRIKQLSNLYRLVEKNSFFTPALDFFFMPILSLGKVFSEGVSKLNFFTFIFDFIIEAPFKLIVEVIEEWITFVRQKKEEIV